MNTKRIAMFAIFIATLVGSLILFPHLPATVASHWGAAGEVNGTMSRFWGVAITPIVMALLIAIFLGLPHIDPKRANIEGMRDKLEDFVLVLLLFFAYIDALTLAWNLGHRFDMGRWIIPAIAVLYYAMGVFLAGARQNWFFGIRTPWTLSNETVWKRTHELSGKLFKACAVIALLGLFFPKGSVLWFAIVPVLAVAVFVVVYSYVLFQRVQKR